MGENNESLGSLWVESGGHRIHYRASVDSTGLLPPVVLIHGLGVSSRYMLPTAVRLAPYRIVYAPDLPGFGKSSKPPRALNITELADALAGWMAKLGIARSAFIANSIGCQVVVELGLGRPEMVERLVLVSPTVDKDARAVFPALARLLLAIPHERPSLAFIALWDYLLAGVGRTGMTFGYAIQDKIEERLAGIAQPTLVVRGGLDPVVPQRWAEEVTRRLPSGRLIVIEHAGHAVNHNSPEQLARVVLDFLGGEA